MFLSDLNEDRFRPTMRKGETVVRKVNSLITGEIGIDGADYHRRTKGPRSDALCSGESPFNTFRPASTRDPFSH